MKICRSNIEDSTRKGLGEPVKTFGFFWLLKSSCLDNILYQSYHPLSPTLAKTIGSQMEFHRPNKEIIVERVRENHFRPFGSFVLLQNDKKILSSYHPLLHRHSGLE